MVWVGTPSGKELCSNGYCRSFVSKNKSPSRRYRGIKISAIFSEVQVADVTDSKAVLENFLFQWSICQMTFYVCGTQV